MNSLLILPILVAFLASTHASPTVQATGYQYGIQMDAGSTGTRLYVYKWKARIFDTLPPSLTQVYNPKSWSNHIKPGISAGTSIQPLLDFAIEKLKSEGVTDLSGVPVFLGATAGMRMLPPTQVTAILSGIQATVKQAGFLYKPEWIRVLSGEEEGTFGWVAVNSLLGTLQSQSSQTFGALDLGGASTQVTFHPDESILAGLFPLKIAQNSHMLYTHSYLYYGADQARYRMYTDLESTAAVSAKEVKSVNNPCFPIGYTEAPNPTHPTVEFVGTSDWGKCLAAASKLITDYQPLTPSSPNGVQCLHSDHERCTFNGVYQPKIPAGMTLLAMSSFFFNWDFFQLKTGTGSKSSDVTALLAAAESFCTKDAAGQAAYNNSLPDPQPAPYCYDYCFGAAYSKALLVDGYGLDATKTPIEVVDKIMVDGQKNDVTWAYGAMLYEINRLGWTYDAPTATPFSTPFYVSLAISLLLLTVTFFLAFKLQRIKNRGGGTSEDASYSSI